jgi:succinate dehydrogenase hydrophobic anchor subunit
MNELNEDQSSEAFSRKWLLIVLVCSIPLFFVFAVLGNPGRGRTAGISAAVGMIVIRACWNLRKHTWFWATAAVLLALHVFLVVRIPWDDKSYPGYTLLPFAALDYGIMYGSFKFAEKLMKKTDTSPT